MMTTSSHHHLIHFPSSPWSERAKFAIQIAELPNVTFEEFVPIISQPALRVRLGALSSLNPFRSVTVPVMFVRDSPSSWSKLVYDDSLKIAQYACDNSPQKKLKMGDPETLDKVIAACERIQQNGRYRTGERLSQSREFDIEVIPPPFRLLPNAVNSFTTRVVGSFLLGKYGRQSAGDYEKALEEMQAGMGELRTLLGGREFFCPVEGFTYVDIVAGAAMNFVSPNEYANVGPVTARLTSEPVLQEEFDDLLKWRDGIYAAHRRRMPGEKKKR